MSDMADTENTNINPWKLIYTDFKPESEKSRESLLAVGNGLTVTGNGIWLVTQPAGLVSMTETFPLVTPKSIFTSFAVSGGLTNAPGGLNHW